MGRGGNPHERNPCVVVVRQEVRCKDVLTGNSIMFAKNAGRKKVVLTCCTFGVALTIVTPSRLGTIGEGWMMKTEKGAGLAGR